MILCICTVYMYYTCRYLYIFLPAGSLDWVHICRTASKVVTFIDLAGHEKYLKTTIFGMTGHAPDFCMLMIGSNAGIIGMTKGIVCICVSMICIYMCKLICIYTCTCTCTCWCVCACVCCVHVHVHVCV